METYELKGNDNTREPLLVETIERFIFVPSSQKLWQMAKKQQASMWTAEEIDLSADKKDWTELTSNEQYFIKYVLAFLNSSEGIVIENLAARFLTEVQLPEARFFYGFQIAIENVHAETYSLLLQTFVPDKKERNELFHAIETIPCIRAKAQWGLLCETQSFAERLVMQAAVEGIFFSGSFCSIFWLKKRGKMPGFGFSNELISRDEGLHCDFACELFRQLRYPLPESKVQKIIRSAVDIEKNFVCDSLPVDLIGMNSRLLSQYIEFIADRLLLDLQCDKIYNTPNPFEWMTLISMSGKTNFFEKRVSEYQKAGICKTEEEQHWKETADSFTDGSDFSLEAEF